METHVVTAYVARAMGPPKASKLLFVGGSVAFGVRTNGIRSFPPSTAQKWKLFKKN